MTKEELEARFKSLPDIRECFLVSGLNIPNPEHAVKEAISNLDEELLLLLENTVAAVNAKKELSDIINRAKEKAKLIDKGKILLGHVLDVHTQIIISEADFMLVLASPEIALIERCLLNGSLGTAKTTLANLDITNLPHTEEIRNKMLSFFDL